ncbi:MAG: ABC transporter ATP-binding protein, partial [Clostridia bacterium]|nr:ABC transporter ATP-binding protein [Clostridia bacterium]
MAKQNKLSARDTRKTPLTVLHYLRAYRAHIVVSGLLAIVSVALTLYIPIVIGDAIDLIVDAGQVDFVGITPLLLRVAVCSVIIALSQWLMSMLNNKITFEVVRDTRGAAFRHIQKLPLSYLDTKPTGEIVSRVIADVDQFADGLLLGFTQLFTGVLTILGTLIFMLTLHPLITLVVVVLTPLSLFVARYIATHTHDMFVKQSEVRGEQTSLIEEMIGNAKVVKAFSHEDEALSEFDEI